MTNERKIIQRIKGLEDKLDGLYAILKAKSEEETWVTARYLVTAFGLTSDEVRRLRRTGMMKSKGTGKRKRYLLESFPERLKKKEAGDKTNLLKNDQ